MKKSLSILSFFHFQGNLARADIKGFTFKNASSILNANKNNIDDPIFIKNFTRPTEESELKTPEFALLFDRLARKHNFDISNCYVLQNNQCLDSLSFEKAANYTMDNRIDINSIYHHSAHYLLISYIYNADNKEGIFYVFDSSNSAIIEKLLEYTQGHIDFANNTYVIAPEDDLSPEKMLYRQFAHFGCNIFAYKDLKTILSKLELLETVKNSVKNLSSEHANFFLEYPAQMLKLHQSMSKLSKHKIKDDPIKGELTLWEYMKIGKEGYEVKSFDTVDVTPKNRLAEYFMQKYTKKTFAKELKKLETKENIGKLLFTRDLLERLKNYDQEKTLS